MYGAQRTHPVGVDEGIGSYRAGGLVHAICPYRCSRNFGCIL